jgi:hypothetical protein
MFKQLNLTQSVLIIGLIFSSAGLLGQNKVDVIVSMANKNSITMKDLGARILLVSNTLDTVLVPK